MPCVKEVPMSTNESEAPPSPAAKKRPWLRLGLLAVVLVGVIALVRAMGWDEQFDPEHMRSLILSSGGWGVALFFVVFSVGVLLQVPGFVFVLAAVAVYGQVAGGLLGYVAALFAVSVSFWLVRLVGGSALSTLEKPLIKKILGRLDEHPLTTVAVLRMLTWMAPPVNYALALTNLSYGKYLLGSALGLIPPIFVAVVLYEGAVAYFT